MRELFYELAGYRSQEFPEWVIWGAGNRGVTLLKYVLKLQDEAVYLSLIHI